MVSKKEKQVYFNIFLFFTVISAAILAIFWYSDIFAHIVSIVVVINSLLVILATIEIFVIAKAKKIREEEITAIFVKKNKIGISNEKFVERFIYGISIIVMIMGFSVVGNNFVVKGEVFITIITSVLVAMFYFLSFIMFLKEYINNYFEQRINEIEIKEQMKKNRIHFRSNITIQILTYLGYLLITLIYSVLYIEKIINKKMYILFIIVFTMNYFILSITILIYKRHHYCNN
ncbi:hypothetical protein BN85400750 [Alteracholeplasma palmae J233]|uniref:Uncharacterized protein n=1 Tax=Alteracholeplasma palmae (strain ATCC 49389 / J233) TaxID=1318466 RepID=U4KJQ1_ALTPJ|nr:hypothetical protein [Alteracholeplasma palmae]CCV63652.1 hypothetical protein BN85400750 [Alteracholeplasma palmae J233]